MAISVRGPVQPRQGTVAARAALTALIAFAGDLACNGPTREYYDPIGTEAGMPTTGGIAATRIGTSSAGSLNSFGSAGAGPSTLGNPAGNSALVTAAGTPALASNTLALGVGGSAGTTSLVSASGAGGWLGNGGNIGVAGTQGDGGTTESSSARPAGGASATSGTLAFGGLPATTIASSNGGSLDAGGAAGESGGSGGATTIAAGGVGIPLGGSSSTSTLGKSLGQPCAVGAECSSLYCIDGVCCAESQCPECMNCGSTGQCINKVVGQPDPSGKLCSGNRSCDPTGICRSMAGQPCASDSECLDGYCADGACCKSRCNGVCETCDNTGTCQRAILREDDSCRTDATGTRMCDAQGLCSMPHLIKDVNPMSYTVGGVTNTYPSYPRGFTQGPDRRVYFSATDGTSGEELWVTDGTASGTLLVADLIAGTGNSGPRGLVNAGSNLFFSAFDSTGIAKLFATNGTMAGTHLVKDLGNSAFGGNVLSARALGNLIYFSGCSSASGCELWRSDGTETGTFMVADIMNTTLSGSTTQTFGSNPTELTVMGGFVYFRAASQVIGLGSTNTLADYELWRSDGLATNTVRVVDIDSGVSNSMPTNLAVLQSPFGPRLLLAASRNATNQELYVSDGSIGNVVSVDINPGWSGSSPGPFVTMGNRAYFAATDPTNGRELWSTDGTTAGTYLVSDIYPGANSGGPTQLTAVGNSLYFQALDAAGSALWRTDATSNATSRVYSGFTPTGAALFEMAAFGNRLFLATAGTGAQELWITDGTTAGTFRSCPDRAQPCGVPFGSNPSGMSVLGGRLYFNATALPTVGGSLGAEPFVYP